MCAVGPYTTESQSCILACVLEGGKIVSAVNSRMGRKRRVTLTTEQLRASSKKSRKMKKKKVLCVSLVSIVFNKVCS